MEASGRDAIDGGVKPDVLRRLKTGSILMSAPEEVTDRIRYGDWEADLIQGGAKSGFLLSLYERKSRVAKLYKLEKKESQGVVVGVVMILKNFEVKTITYHNGLEFGMNGFINDLLGCESYFCKPYSSWEKGGVENYNGLVRSSSGFRFSAKLKLRNGGSK